MRINVNLLPWRDEQREVKKKQFFTGLAGMAGFGLMAVILMHFIYDAKINTQSERNHYLTQEISLLNKKIKNISTLEKEKTDLLARVDIIQRLQVTRPVVVRLFDMVPRILPKGVYLVDWRKKSNDLEFTGKTESNTRISEFMRNIDLSDWTEHAVLQEIKAPEKNSSKRFSDFRVSVKMQIGKEKKPLGSE